MVFVCVKWGEIKYHQALLSFVSANCSASLAAAVPLEKGSSNTLMPVNEPSPSRHCSAQIASLLPPYIDLISHSFSAWSVFPSLLFFLIDRNRGVEKEEGVMGIKEICKKSLLKRLWGNEKKVSESCHFNFFFLFCGVGKRSITLFWSLRWFLLCPLCVRVVGSSTVVAPGDYRQLTAHLPRVTVPVFRTRTAHSCVELQLSLATDTNRL